MEKSLKQIIRESIFGEEDTDGEQEKFPSIIMTHEMVKGHMDQVIEEQESSQFRPARKLADIIDESVGLPPIERHHKLVDGFSKYISSSPSGSSYRNSSVRSDIEVRTCPYCKYKNRIDYSRLPAVVVLKCGNCGGVLE